MLRLIKNLAGFLVVLVVAGAVASPLHAGTAGETSEELLAALGRRIQNIKSYAVTVRYTRRSGTTLKRNVVRYESWGPSLNIRIRYLEGERAGVEALYTASQNLVKIRLPYLPITLSLNPDEVGGDRPIYETHLRNIIGRLREPGWEAKKLTLVGSSEWPRWALTMENRRLAQRVLLVVDERQWLPVRIERFKAGTSDYEVWKFEDYSVDPPLYGDAPKKLYW